jgi:glycerol-3-phosphate dehydrogenase
VSSRIPHRAPLEPGRFDVAVIGGGINGVAIARECAEHGKRVLLLERSDFASGTTSRSTRIIHGGLRYLEHAEISLVRESLREREHLLRERPHLVHPMRFVLALGAGRRHSALEVRTGLWLYHRMAGAPARHLGGAGDLRQLESQLDKGQRWSLFDYDDAQCEFPERLVAEWLVEAAQAGAELRNHCEVLQVVTTEGRARGIIYRDLITGDEGVAEADWIINASGPWADEMCARSGVCSDGPLVGGIRGSHLVVAKFPGAPDTALYTEASDGRPIFVIPWNDQLLVGTTEIPDRDNPSHTEPTLDEVEYLIRSLNALYPQARVKSEDVQYAFAGIRPLPYSDGVPPSAVTRKHLLHDHTAEGAAGLISIIGGKLTTAAALARDCARHIGIHSRPPRVIHAAIGDSSGIERTIAQWSLAVATLAGIGQESACAIAKMRGRRALCVARMAKEDHRLRVPICEHSPHIVAEAADAVRFEHALRLGDILLRRVPVALGGCWSEDCSRTAATRIGEALGWDNRRINTELEDFEIERRAFLKRPSRDPLRRQPVITAESVA